MNAKSHWERIYERKAPFELLDTPVKSTKRLLALSKSSSIVFAVSIKRTKGKRKQ